MTTSAPPTTGGQGSGALPPGSQSPYKHQALAYSGSSLLKAHVSGCLLCSAPLTCSSTVVFWNPPQVNDSHSNPLLGFGSGEPKL